MLEDPAASTRHWVAGSPDGYSPKESTPYEVLRMVRWRNGAEQNGDMFCRALNSQQTISINHRSVEGLKSIHSYCL